MLLYPSDSVWGNLNCKFLLVHLGHTHYTFPIDSLNNKVSCVISSWILITVNLKYIATAAIHPENWFRVVALVSKNIEFKWTHTHQNQLINLSMTAFPIKMGKVRRLPD